jgi:hypothetical protein
MDLPSGVNALEVLVREPKKSTATKIWDKKKEDLLADLTASIEQAKGRYVENIRASHAEGAPAVVLMEDGKPKLDKNGNQITLSKVSAAPNWRVQMNAKTKNLSARPVLVDSKDKNKEFPAEAVFVYLKAGRTKVPLFDTADGCKESEKRLSSDDLVAVLEYFKAQVEDWTPDSESGRIFHQVGVIDAIAPKVRNTLSGYAHCLEEDRIVEVAKVKQKSPYSLDLKLGSTMSVKGGLLDKDLNA